MMCGKRVSLMISDPWDFGTECGVGPFYGCLEDNDAVRALVSLELPIEYSNATYLSAYCQVRHEGASIYDLEKGNAISANIILLPLKFRNISVTENKLYEGGFNAIGSLEQTDD